MAGTGIGTDLILSSLGYAVGLGTAAAVVASVVYRLARPVAEAGFGPSRHPTQARARRLTLEADARWLAAAAYRRAIGVAVALLVFLVAAPWLDDPIDRLFARWRAAVDGQDWRYALLAAVLWLGLLPLAVCLWALPRRAWGRRSLRRKGWATRLGTSTSPGLPGAVGPADVESTPPYCAALRRACRQLGVNAALGAGGGRGEGAADALIPAAVFVPATAGLLLAGFIQIWIALAAVVAIGLTSVAAGANARRNALRAPGTTALDYLILVAAARDGRCADARIRAESYLAPNPATLQDHAALIKALAGARWIDEPAWNPIPVSHAEVVVPAAMDFVDRGGKETRLHVAIRLVRGTDRHWQVTRVWAEQTASTDGVSRRDATPVPIAW